MVRVLENMLDKELENLVLELSQVAPDSSWILNLLIFVTGV
jgi:hypothetical protein